MAKKSKHVWFEGITPATQSHLKYIYPVNSDFNFLTLVYTSKRAGTKTVGSGLAFFDSRLPTSVIQQTLIVLGFNGTSTLVDHFVSSPREREKRDKRDSRGGEERDREERGTGMKGKKQKK